ncbi:MAG: hypothetical protein LBV16_00860 [Elusimicrobiota bacterium]|jgi:LPS-assembly protein|nr:hypothetical protein [Elusimicrobiota bacterium]
MKKIYKIKYFLISCLSFLFFSISVFSYDIDINADALDYNQADGMIVAQGNVILKWEGRTVYADFVEFSFDNKEMFARGNVKVEDAQGVFLADNMRYFYDAEKGELNDSRIYSSQFFSHSAQINRLDEENYEINKIRISNCDLDEPHTYFKANRATLRTEKRITLYNAVFYIGKVPIFYFPIITKSLDGGKQYGFDYEIEPGYTKEGGVSVKNTISYRFSDALIARAFVDYLGAYGVGYGSRINYDAKRANGALYGYIIDDKITGGQRWAFRSNIYARFSNNWLLQSQGEFFSDPNFNKSFDRSNSNMVAVRPHSYISLTKNAQSSNINLILEQYQKYQNQEYVPQSESIPKISYTLYPKKIFGGITGNFNAHYERGYRDSYSEKFYKNMGDFAYTIAKDFKFGRKFTLKPSAGIASNLYDLNDKGEDDNTIIANYIGAINSRLRVTQWMDWNIVYSVKTAGKKNSFDIDSIRNDYGIQTHSLSFNNYMYIGDRTTIRNYTTYDLRTLRDNNDIARWAPLNSELIYTPTYNSTIYLKHTQNLAPNSYFKGLQLDITLGMVELAYFNAGVFYQDSRPNEMDNNFTIGLWLNPKWRFDYTVRMNTKLKDSLLKMTSQELRLYRDIHCYNLGFTWRVTGENYADYDIFLKFDLKTNMPFTKENIEKYNYSDGENVFYPW